MKLTDTVNRPSPEGNSEYFPRKRFKGTHRDKQIITGTPKKVFGMT